MANKILFIPFCTGAGHSGRMLVMAQALKERLEGTIEFAGSGKYGALFSRAGFRFHELEGPDFTLHRGKADLVRLHAQKTSVREYIGFFKEVMGLIPQMITHELELYRSVKPDLIVWDGRWTATISAEVAGIPFVSVMNTILTPYSRIRGGFPRTFPLFTTYPWLRTPVVKLPQTVQRWLFYRYLDLFFFFSLRFVNKLRASLGLPAFTSSSELFYPGLRTVIVPEPDILSPVITPPPNFHYVGPVVWQPEMEIPEPVRDLRDIIYISMGTTGNPLVFKPLIQALASMPQCSVVVTVGDLIEVEALKPWPGHVHVYPFLPGIEMAKRARLMICHGALATMAQALSHGVPVLTIPLTIQHEIWSDLVEMLGVGLKLYMFELTPQKVHRVVEQLLTDERHRRAAENLAPRCRLKGGPERAAELILGKLGRA